MQQTITRVTAATGRPTLAVTGRPTSEQLRVLSLRIHPCSVIYAFQCGY
jgi:hypothetical protein